MEDWNKIPEPLNFNPLKHHLDFIRIFTAQCSNLSEEKIKSNIVPLLRHLGTSVADIYTGRLEIQDIVNEINSFRKESGVLEKEKFIIWMNQSAGGYRKCTLSDSSQWVIKYLGDNHRYFHFFPGRNVEYTVRSRGNSLKTAILYDILFDKGDIFIGDLNSVRKMLKLSPLRNTESALGIINDIRMLQELS